MCKCPICKKSLILDDIEESDYYTEEECIPIQHCDFCGEMFCENCVKQSPKDEEDWICKKCYKEFFGKRFDSIPMIFYEFVFEFSDNVGYLYTNYEENKRKRKNKLQIGKLQNWNKLILK